MEPPSEKSLRRGSLQRTVHTSAYTNLVPSSRMHTLLCIAYGEGVVLIIDVVRANEFLQDEIGMRTSPDPYVRSKLVRDDTPD